MITGHGCSSIQLTRSHEIICYLPNLRSFTCQTFCNDLILENVAKLCPDIQEIDIKGSMMIDKGIKRLCKTENGEALCTKLKKLYVENSNIRDEDVEYLLKNLPSLEILDYPNLPFVIYSLHRKDLSSLNKVQPYNIIKLNITRFYTSAFYEDILKVCLSVCTHLKSLRCVFFKKDYLSLISNLSELGDLTLENIPGSNINIDELLKSVGSKLTYLSMDHCTVSVSVIAECCPRLEILKLNSVHFLLDSDSKPIFNSLSSITFENYNIPKCVKAITLLLSSSTKLESLSFETCHLFSSEIKALILKTCELYPIKKISFCASVIDKDYIKDLLFNCHSLKYLNIVGFFDVDQELELLDFAETLPNKPKIDTGESMDINDSEVYSDGNSELEDDDFDNNDFDGNDEDYNDYAFAYEYDAHEGNYEI